MRNLQRIIYMFCHYAQQPPYNAALRYHNWGKELAKRGYRVTIFAASVVHNSDVDVMDKLGGSQTSQCEGVNYVYVKTSKYSGNGIARIRNMWQYYERVKAIARIYERPDVSICCCAYLLQRVRGFWAGVPCICDIEDLWPESIVEIMRISKRNPIIKFLYHVEKEAYRKCDALVFSMAGGYEYITDKGWNALIPKEKVFHINMGVDLDEFDKNRDTVVYDDPRLHDESLFKVVYCGSVRAANCIKSICDAAKIIQDRGVSDVAFMIHGAGTQVDELTEYCESNGITNVTFYGRIQKKQIPYVLSHADVCCFTFANMGLMKYGGSQQKSFEYYASGKPIVSNWNSGYNLIKDYDCGIVTKTQEASELAEAVLEIYEMPDVERQRLGNNARRIAEDYSQNKLVDQLEEIIASL